MSGSDAARAIYQASHQRLVVQLYGITGDLHEAQDAVQEAFVRALSRGGRLAAMDNPEAWLRTVAVNIARSRWRRQQAMEGFLLRRVIDEPVPVRGMTEDHVALVTALRHLPRAQRETVVLHYLADLTVEQIAASLGVAPGTVKSRLHRARARLAELLDPTEPGAMATGSRRTQEENHV
jgi:RNA polymerase sigma-70 factor (sigma-E family)